MDVLTTTPCNSAATESLETWNTGTVPFHRAVYRGRKIPPHYPRRNMSRPLSEDSFILHLFIGNTLSPPPSSRPLTTPTLISREKKRYGLFCASGRWKTEIMEKFHYPGEILRRHYVSRTSSCAGFQIPTQSTIFLFSPKPGRASSRFYLSVDAARRGKVISVGKHDLTD